MNKHSRNKLLATFEYWKVPKDYAEPMFNYLVYGYEPGSFFTSVLANDFFRAVQRSHPGNTIEALKSLVGWIGDCMPQSAFGSYAEINEWRKLTAVERRAVLEECNLIYSIEDEAMLVLQGEPTHEPMLW